MARVVTVHLVIPDAHLALDEAERPHLTEGHIADYVSNMLTHTLEFEGTILDWGYAEGGFPEHARFVDEKEYKEGDFYTRSGLRPSYPGIRTEE